MVPEPVDFNLEEAIQDVMVFYKPYALDKQIKLSALNITPFNVLADKNMIRVVLRNLISNAIKFTQPGGEVQVIMIPKENNVEITVQDNGLGMSPEVLENLFRLDKAQTSLGTSGEKGTGLGLHLCQEFVGLNKGTLKVESLKGFGSVFRFTIPTAL